MSNITIVVNGGIVVEEDSDTINVVVGGFNNSTTLVDYNAVGSYQAGKKQTFSPDSDNAGMNAGSYAGNPATLANADIWYNSSTNQLFGRIGGTNVDLGAGGGDSWSDAVDSNVVPDTDSAYNIGSASFRFANVYSDAIDIGGNITVGGTVDGRDVAADGTKLDYITVTQAVDLDAIESRVNELDASVVLKGSWDASAGSFPGGGTAQAGDSYIVSTDGTVDSVEFTANDRIVAITDNASTSTYAANWLKLDYTDAVLSVAGKTGAVILAASDVASGTFADERISESSVTQHQAALSIAESQVSGLGTLATQDSDNVSITGGNVAVSGFLNIGAAINKTISSGAISISSSNIIVDTESAAASDDLDTITGGTEGDTVCLRALSSARTVVVKNGTGNIWLGADFSLDNLLDSIKLIKQGSIWLRYSSANNGL
ncbi:MAG: hypothetical protein PQ612_06080 [Rickettsiales bacterium]|nr:hypothetical protein [Pseudomonadota bacterium]MDA0966892.1 hypothetical protein [Pseudomonadota bacterium]MDG4543567.1 hypothetical protein [Rickettsiales bacterium]MDG4545715.1 hypothetical protein [Rickettsiales bacterium]MDG4547512.1 hypothetical protein [Rickettsiales bacterium]